VILRCIFSKTFGQCNTVCPLCCFCWLNHPWRRHSAANCNDDGLNACVSHPIFNRTSGRKQSAVEHGGGSVLHPSKNSDEDDVQTLILKKHRRHCTENFPPVLRPKPALSLLRSSRKKREKTHPMITSAFQLTEITKNERRMPICLTKES